MNFKIIQGDLFQYIIDNKIAVTAQGCNCFSLQNAGIAKYFSTYFSTDKFEYEHEKFKGFYNKLGVINWVKLFYDIDFSTTYFFKDTTIEQRENLNELIVVNCYTQFEPGANAEIVWLASCLKKINYDFKGQTLAIPLIGGGIGGLNPLKVIELMKVTLKDTHCTLILTPEIYNKYVK